MTTSIETTSGLYLDYKNPRPEQITVEDIARALSHIPRFGGHTSQFYSVAQHAVLVMDLVIHFHAPSLALAALHHDSHEAYVGDIPSPLKALLDVPFQVLVQRLDSAIAPAVGCWSKDFRASIVKVADRLALRMEADQLKTSNGVGDHWGYDERLPDEAFNPCWHWAAWDSETAEDQFLLAHKQASALQR